MSANSSGNGEALDKIAELVAGSARDDASLELLLSLIGALDPLPRAGELRSAARLFGRLRLAQVLDHPSRLRLGAVRLLVALDATSSPTFAARPASSPQPLASGDPPGDEPPPVRPSREPVATGRRSSRAGGGRVILSYPRPGEVEEEDEPRHGESVPIAADREPEPEPEPNLEPMPPLPRAVVEAPPSFTEASDPSGSGVERERSPAASPPTPSLRLPVDRSWLGILAVAIALVALARALAKAR